jgi:hypothetical protein
MPRTRTLGQVIGVERHLRRADNDTGKALLKRVQSQELTSGHIRTYTPDDGDAGEAAREADKHKLVAITAENALAEAKKYSVPAMDVVATKDATNQHANADLIVDGEVLVPAVPISHLLWLEDYFAEWRKFLTALPVLNPTRAWHEDKDRGIHVSSTDVTARFLRTTVALQLHGGNDKFSPAAQPIEKEVKVGTYSDTDLSGAVKESRKKQLLANCDTLQAAVRDAIARANQTVAVEVSEGDLLLTRLLA